MVLILDISKLEISSIYSHIFTPYIYIKLLIDVFQNTPNKCMCYTYHYIIFNYIYYF
jgi:hypothetical protein